MNKETFSFLVEAFQAVCVELCEFSFLVWCLSDHISALTLSLKLIKLLMKVKCFPDVWLTDFH